MNRFLLSFLVVLLAFPTFGQTSTNGNSINQVDENNRKQGHWVIKAEAGKPNDYKTGSIYTEGEYENGRKTGLWDVYYPNGKLKSKITYENSRPRGPYILYYENGNIEEEGNWERTKNTNSFKRYHPNGKISQDFTFTETGKRSGKQTYYYDNGKVQLEGSWDEGKKSGEMKEYYENGDLRAVKQFNNGDLNTSTLEEYAPKTPQKDDLEKQNAEGKNIVVKADSKEKPNQGGFSGNGYKKLYNINLQIAKDGIFRNFRLIDGKSYEYDENGLLLQIRVFKNGKYIGDGVLPKEDS